MLKKADLIEGAIAADKKRIVLLKMDWV